MNDESDLPAAVAEARFQYFGLARQLLNADPLVTGIDAATIRMIDQFKAAGWSLAVELSTDSAGCTVISMTAVSTDGRRQVLRTISEASITAQ